jgi:hypothetical protein
MSHSVQQTNSQPTYVENRILQNEPKLSVISELDGNKVILYIDFNSNKNNVSGVQLIINYDNTRLNFDKVEYETGKNSTNFINDRGSYVSVGSIITDGVNSFDDTMGYKVIFNTKQNVKNVLGLINIQNTDVVGKDGKKIKVRIE